VFASKHTDSNILLCGIHDTAFNTLVVKGSGKVGIGTATPASLLDLGSSGGRKLLLYGNSATNMNTQGFGIDLGGYSYGSSWWFPYGSSGSGRAEILSWDGSSYTSRFVVKGDGNVEVSDGTLKSGVSGTFSIHGGTGTAGNKNYATYGFKDDPNTGMYRASADTLGFTTGGSERLRISSSGTTDIKCYNGTSSSPTESRDWPTPALALRSYGNYFKESMLSFGYPNDAIYQTGDTVWNFRLHDNGYDGQPINYATSSDSYTDLELFGPGNFRINCNLELQAGKGIDFSAQTATSASGATTTSELLDHYEEGTWTPQLTDPAGNQLDHAAGYTTGYYTKIGNLVHISAQVITSNTASASGNLRLQGLPFTVANHQAAYSGSTVGYATGLNISAGESIGFYFGVNSTTAHVRHWNTSSGQTSLTVAEWSDNGNAMFSGSYRAA
jgi:hypothetical protein